jgi:Lrp/AsnC family transcriptional regulator, leucine-responsive regulatory protein
LTLDDADLRLLDLLQHDASLSNQALAERAHLSAPTSLRRVKRLRALGLIERRWPCCTRTAWPARSVTA